MTSQIQRLFRISTIFSLHHAKAAIGADILRVFFVLSVLMTLAAASIVPACGEQPSNTMVPTHVKNEFQLTAHGPYSSVAPLFGAHGERQWAGDSWQPQFLYPSPENDLQGAVFRTNHGGHTSVWVTTRFDLAAKEIQHVFFIPDALVTVIDIHFTNIDERTTRVSVSYERTALDAKVNDHVVELGKADLTKAKEWEEQINKFLATKAQ